MRPTLTCCLAARRIFVAALLAAVAPAAGSASATNGKIVFTSDRDGNQQLYLMNEDGSEQQRLTHNGGIDCFPAFSPDGRRIAFVGAGRSTSYAIKVMNADGTETAEVTPLDFRPSPFPWHDLWALSWSPDGKQIAFQEAGDIFTVKVDGTDRRNLTNHPALDLEPAWSPDGARILFVSARVYWLTLHTMKADGTEVRELPSAGEFWDTTPAFSPTGGKIVFMVRSEMTLPAIYTANSDGSERALFDYCGTGTCSTHRNRPRWSPDGQKIVYHVWEYFTGDAQIHVKSLAGTSATQLTQAPGRNFQPCWQPVHPAQAEETTSDGPF